ITTVYTFRMVFLTFFGEVKTQVTRVPGLAINISLVVLAILSTIGGFIEIPHSMGHVQMVTDFLSPVLPVTSIRPGIESSEWIIQLAAAILSIGGLLLAYFLYMKRPSLHFKIKNSIPHLHSFWLSGWRFDSLYDWLVVRPFVYVANINKNDPFNGPYNGVVRAANFFHRILSFTQSGILRWYLIGVVIGAILILTLGIWL
ncbi:MAG: NADH-quinone oxidoreductase subunit L, partial [Cyclobacteriaceae bacterium]|nr:NADH-quinone oxidoreductase subunit L [Cyclobacteriaceae bacterium]